MRVLRIDQNSPYRQLLGVGGIGSGIFFHLEGDQTLGRNESRPGRLLDVRDYCKLHIVIHYVAKLLGARVSGSPFHVLPVGKVGEDAPGRQVVREMTEAGIDTRLVQAMPDRPTLFSVCFQYPDGAGGNITTSNSAASVLCAEDVDGVVGLLEAGASHAIALAVPEVMLEVRQRFLQLATRTGALRVASFVPAEIESARQAGMFEMLDLVSLNEEEAGELIGCAFVSTAADAFVARCQDFLRNSYPNLQMVVSAGNGGAYGVSTGSWNHCPAPEVEVASTAGAGDAMLGGIIAALAAGIPFLHAKSTRRVGDRRIQTALELGVLLGSYKCLSPHTIHPSAGMDALIGFGRDRGQGFCPQIEELLTAQVPA
jgi:sugar/nucleoside kinase (ribokinase family)